MRGFLLCNGCKWVGTVRVGIVGRISGTSREYTDVIFRNLGRNIGSRLVRRMIIVREQIVEDNSLG